MSKTRANKLRVARTIAADFALIAAPGLLLALAGSIGSATSDSLANGYFAPGYRSLALGVFALETDRNMLVALIGAAVAALLVALPRALRLRRTPLVAAAVFAVMLVVAVSILFSDGWRVADYRPAVDAPLPRALHRNLLASVGGAIAAVSLLALWLARPAADQRRAGERLLRAGGAPQRLAAIALVSTIAIWATPHVLAPLVVQPAPRPFPVIYIAWDSVRADFVSGYGHARETTPNLDEFSRGAVLFERTVSPSTWTRPSFTSIMTSVPFWKIGGLGSRAGSRYLTLSELLKNRGYRTIGYAQNPNLDAELGFDQGFDKYVHVYASQEPELMNRLVLPRIGELLSSEQPFFLFIHYQEPHWPYRDKGGSRAAPGAVTLDEEAVAALMRRDTAWDADAPQASAQLEFLHRAYEADIRATDAALGELLDTLRRSALWDRALIVFNSDHGEEFHEHGSFGHAHANLYPELTFVPQVIKFPAALGIPARRVEAVVETQDVVPTILDALGIAAPRQIEGRSLLQLDRLDDEPWVARSAFDNLLMLRSRGQAMLVDTGDDPKRQYFDRNADPQELSPVAWDPDDPSMARINALAAPFVQEWVRRGSGQGPAEDDSTLDPELQRRLKALGYIR